MLSEKTIHKVGRIDQVVRDYFTDDNDLKQMFFYNLFWNCDRSILLYPAVNEIFGDGVYYAFNQNKENFAVKIKDICHSKCLIETINILDGDEGLDKDIGTKIIRRIFSDIVKK